MLFRKKQENDAATTASPVETTAGKGHATPKRKESQAARHRPLVADDRKSARAANKAARDAAYAKQQYALEHAIEKDLPLRDKGAARRFARDYMDASYNFGELFMPMAVLLMALVLLLGASGQTELYTYTTMGMYGVILIGLAHSWIGAIQMYRTLIKYVHEEDIPKGTTFYAFQRAFQVRRWRLPKPQVKRGEFPQRSMTPLA